MSDKKKITIYVKFIICYMCILIITLNLNISTGEEGRNVNGKTNIPNISSPCGIIIDFTSR